MVYVWQLMLSVNSKRNLNSTSSHAVEGQALSLKSYLSYHSWSHSHIQLLLRLKVVALIQGLLDGLGRFLASAAESCSITFGSVSPFRLSAGPVKG